jgi:ABC-type multidrug transport system ATPase subunit
MEAVVERLDVGDWVESLPEGLMTSVGERGEQLSAGERQLVALLRAGVADPDVLVLDEPTVGQDPLLRRELWDEFHGLAGNGATLLVSSHVMDEADRCDGLLLLRDGELLATGTPDELRERTQTRDLDDAFLRLVEEAA